MRRRNWKRWLTGFVCGVLVLNSVMSTEILASAAEVDTVELTEGENLGEGSSADIEDGMENDEPIGDGKVEADDAQGGNSEEENSQEDGACVEDSEKDSDEADKEENGSEEEVNGENIGNEEGNLEAETDEEGSDEAVGYVGEVFEDDLLALSVGDRLVAMSSADDIASGTYEDIVWVIDANGKLTVMGTGDISSTVGTRRAPWNSYTKDIISAEINVTDMKDASYMFYNCWSLKNIKMSSFDTSTVMDMKGMFWYCSSLTWLDVSNFNTGRVTDMNRMFSSCDSLTSLDLSHFDTSKVTDMSDMFLGCGALRTLNISSFSTGNVIDMSGMFAICENLTNLDVSGFDTENVKYMGKGNSYIMLSLDADVSYENRMLDESDDIALDYDYLVDCEKIQGYPIGNLSLEGMFSGCSSLTELDLSNFNTSSVIDMSGMFSDCINLRELNISNLKTDNVTDMSGMFYNCSNLKNIDLRNFNAKNVADMEGVSAPKSKMFDGCSSLATIYTPYNIAQHVSLPMDSGDIWYRSDGSTVTELPQNLSYSVVLGKNYIPEEKTAQDQVIELKDGESAVLIYDNSTNLPIEGAKITIGTNTYTTNSDGIARFTAPSDSSKKQILVTASGYNDVTTYQQIKNKHVIRIGLDAVAGSLQIVSANGSLGNDTYDFFREKLVLGYAKSMDDFTNITEGTLHLTIKSNKDKVTYAILSSSANISGGSGGGGGVGFSIGATDTDSNVGSLDSSNSSGGGSGGGGGGSYGDDGKILFTSSTGEFSINVATETVKIGSKEIAKTAVTDIIEPGKKLYVRATDEEGNIVVKRLNISTTYNYLTQDNTSQKDSFKWGNELKVSVPDEVPFIGGTDFAFGFEDKMPVEVEIDEDGKVKISYNKPADIDMDKFSKEYKDLEKKAGRVAKLNSNIAGIKKFSAGMVDVSGRLCGYGEGNISEIMNGNPTIKLGVIAEITGSAGYKHYWVIGFIPVKLFIEGKATGGITAEAGIKFENWKIKSFDISGGSINVTVQLEVGGGVGFGYEVEASLTGKVNYTNKPARDYEKLWLEASGKVKRIILGIWEKNFWESDTYKYTLYQKGTDQQSAYALMQGLDDGKGNSELSLAGRTYLDYTDGYKPLAGNMGAKAYNSGTKNVDTVVKSAVFPTANPTLVETDNEKYLFWIDDITSRNDYNRTAIMYAKSMEGVGWSTPKQLVAESEDNTLDGDYDVFVDGDKIYLAWQDATRQFTEEEEALDVLRSLSVRHAVLDTAQDTVIENKCLTKESGYYMYPSTVAAGDEIYSAYVHNMLDAGDIDGNNTQHLYVVDKEGETKEIAIPQGTQIANMDAGFFAGKASLVCELDMDGDTSTDADREIYLYDFLSESLSRITDNGAADVMPVIADSGNIYWFQNTDIVKLSETGKMPESIWDRQQLAYQTVFTVATDEAGKDTILWESVDTDAEDGSVAIFQTSENQDGTWDNVVKFATTTGTISSRISAAGCGENLQVAHTEGVYLSDGTALKDLCVITRENITDITVGYVDYEEESATAGNALTLKTEVINNGNATVDEITVSVNDTVITTLTGLGLKPMESRELEISGFSVPTSLKEATCFTLKLTAAGEKSLEDNVTEFLLGCPDVYVETDCRIAEERTWLDIGIWNDTAYETSGEVLVHKSTEDGEVIYRKSYNGLGAENGYAYSVDLGNYEDKNVKYYVEITADTEENSLGNNTEFVYIGYGTGIEEEEDVQDIQEVNSISFDNRGLSLGIGDTCQLTAKADKGNAFNQGELLWTSSDNRIASVDQTGFVKAHRVGQAEITAYYGELQCVCSVIVGEDAASQTLAVWFDTQGGEEIAPITGITPGSTVDLPETVKKPGYVFAGWYTQPVNGEKIDGTTLLVEQSITLYAHWIKAQSETGMWMEDITDQIYTGKAIKPQVRVYDGTTLLKEKTDYTISYKNNIKANDASVAKSAPTVTVTGKGNYSGKETITFKILPADLNDTSVITEDMVTAYNGKVQKKVPSVTYNGKKLTNNKDFTVSYPALTQGVTDALKAVGTYDIVLTAKAGGNFTGTRTVKLTITNSTLISKATVKKIPNQSYTGNAIEPELTVTYNKAPLVKGTDYTVSYTNNTETGTATAILTGMGKYAGTKKVTFKITGISIKGAVVSGIADKTYNGTAQKQNITVTLNNTPLTENTDYEVVYSNHTNAGKATITITGIKAYSGVIKKTFKITAYDLKADTENKTGGLEKEITAKYVKGGSKPEVELTFAGKKLTAGKDYTTSYKNNKAVTTAAINKAPTITIKGKGNFKGTLTKTFTITSKALNDAEHPVTLTVADKGFTDKAGNYISKPILTDADGKKLVSGKDYESAVVYTLEDGTELTNKSKVNADTNIKVKVTGKGAYTGELEGIYRIAKNDFSKAQISINPQIYTGEAVTLEKDDITVKIGKEILTLGTDYEIVEGSYRNNVKKGTASVTIVGKGNYGGTKNVKFKITAKKFLWFWRLFA